MKWSYVYWSLNYEEQFYIVMGLIMLASVRLGTSMLTAIAGPMAPALICNIWHPAMPYGLFLEYGIAFSMGACRLSPLPGELEAGSNRH